MRPYVPSTFPGAKVRTGNPVPVRWAEESPLSRVEAPAGGLACVHVLPELPIPEVSSVVSFPRETQVGWKERWVGRGCRVRVPALRCGVGLVSSLYQGRAITESSSRKVPVIIHLVLPPAPL